MKLRHHGISRVSNILLPKSCLLLLTHSMNVLCTEELLVCAVMEVEGQVVHGSVLLGVEMEETHPIKIMLEFSFRGKASVDDHFFVKHYIWYFIQNALV